MTPHGTNGMQACRLVPARPGADTHYPCAIMVWAIAVFGWAACSPALAQNQTQPGASQNQSAADASADLPPETVDPEQLFLAGLRARGLYTLAVTHCEKALSQEAHSSEAEAALRLELSRTYVEYARTLGADERDAIWDRATECVRPFLNAHPDDDRRWQLLIQQALVHLAKAELLRQEAELASGGEESLTLSREAVRAAVTQLEAVKEGLQASLRQPPKRSMERLSPQEIQSLLRNVQFQTARGWKISALSWREGSNDRIDALQQALAQVEPLVHLDARDPLAWHARLEELAIYRLLKRFTPAKAHAKVWKEQGIPPAFAQSFDAESLRQQLADGFLESALETALLQETQHQGKSADWDLAHLEVVLASWRAANQRRDEGAAKRALQHAHELAGYMEQQYGSYWGRRADALLASFVVNTSGVNDVSVLERAAESMLARGQWQDAVATYDKARAEAEKNKSLQSAAMYAVMAAAVEQQQQQLHAAKTRYLEISAAFPESDWAPKAHLQAAELAKELQSTAANPDLSEYDQLLQDILEKWPQSPQAATAAFNRGNSLLQSDRRTAMASFSRVPLEHPLAEEAAAKLTWCALVLAQTSKYTDQFAPRVLSDQAQEFFKRLPTQTAGADRAWNAGQKRLALGIAQLEIRAVRESLRLQNSVGAPAALQNLPDSDPGRTSAQFAGALIQRALNGPVAPQDALRNDFLVEQCALLALTGKAAEAMALLATVQAPASEGGQQPRGLRQALPKTPPVGISCSQGNRILSELTYQLHLPVPAIGERVPYVPSQESTALAALCEEVIRQMRLDPNAPQSLDFEAAKAQALKGDGAAAIVALKQAHDSDPTHWDKLQAIGATLLVYADDDRLKQALELWRASERKFKPGSQEWLEVKLWIVRTLAAQGDLAQAHKVLKLTRLLHPDLANARMRSKFEAAEQTLQAMLAAPGS